MNTFDSMNDIIARINDLIFKLNNAQLNRAELSELEDLSRQLYERSVILNYKAKEEHVFGKKSSEESSVHTEPSGRVEASKAPETEEVLTPQEDEATQVAAQKEEEQAFSFDFSDGFDLTNEVEPEVKEEQTETPFIAEPEPTIQETDTPQEHKVELQEVLQDPKGTDALYRHFSNAYQAAKLDRLGHLKITSLQGAFGLNDKLLFIRELFAGNAEEFNAIVGELDNMDNSDSALQKLSAIAKNREWDKNEPSVNDFANMVIRRYVD